MESERSNNTPPRVPLTDEEDIFDPFDPQYESTLDRSILYYKIQPTAPTNSQGESAQGDPKHVLCVMNPIHYSNLMELTRNQS